MAFSPIVYPIHCICGHVDRGQVRVRGLGDLIELLLTWLGITEPRVQLVCRRLLRVCQWAGIPARRLQRLCGDCGCQARRERLNRAVPLHR